MLVLVKDPSGESMCFRANLIIPIFVSCFNSLLLVVLVTRQEYGIYSSEISEV